MRAAHGTRAFEIDDVVADAFLAALSSVDWQADAACAERLDVEFFPERGESTDPAKAVCVGCLVRLECLAYAVEHNIKFGIWGGASGRDRRRLRARSHEDERAIA